MCPQLVSCCLCISSPLSQANLAAELPCLSVNDAQAVRADGCPHAFGVTISFTSLACEDFDATAQMDVKQSFADFVNVDVANVELTSNCGSVIATLRAVVPSLAVADAAKANIDDLVVPEYLGEYTAEATIDPQGKHCLGLVRLFDCFL